MSNLLVSIHMITYNHENFIAKAIEGILMQKTNFIYQLIIGEDCSTDNTRIICKQYAKDNPTKIKLLPPLKNIGVQNNYIKTFNACKGKYIALCEGDDYWTDPLKLQKQVDVMESDDSISLIYTNCEEKYEHTNLPLKTKYTTQMPEGKCIEDIINGSYPQTVSVMYKKSMLPINLNKILKLHYKMCDYPIVLHLAYSGKVKYIPDVTCVYRKNENSISGEVAKNYLKNIKFMSSCRAVLTDFKKEKQITEPILLKKIDAQLQHWLLTSFSMSLQNHNTNLAKELWKEVKENPTPIPFKYQLLNASASLGFLGKGLINFYYKK